MRLLHCLTNSSVGGGQSTTVTLLRSLGQVRPDLNITVVLPEGEFYRKEFGALGADVRHLPLNELRPGNLSRLSRLAREIAPDVVHSHGKGAGLFARMVPGAGKRFSSVHTFHGFFPPSGPAQRTAYFAAERYLLSRANAAVAVSPSEASELKSCFPGCENKIHTIENVVDGAELDRKAELPLDGDLERFLESNSARTVVTMIARNDPAKNLDLAAETAAILLESELGIAFMFIGPGESHIRLSRLHSQYPNRLFLSGPQTAAAAIVRRSSLMFLTSPKEGGLPLVLQEGFHFGIPAVAVDAPGASDLVQSGMNGMLTPSSASALAEAILSVHRSAELRTRLSHGASATAARFNTVGWAEKYIALYSSLAARA